MSYLDQRPPPCHRCGGVDPAVGRWPDGYRHECHPVMLISVRYGADVADRVGRAVVDAFATLRWT